MKPREPWMFNELTSKKPQPAKPAPTTASPEEPFAPLHAAERPVARPAAGEWVTPRPDLRTFLMGLPALLAGVGVLATLVWIKTHRVVVPRYERDAVAASKAGDYPAEFITFRRLTLEAPNRADYKFGLAMALEALGDAAQSFNILQQLTPPGQLGYPPAQLFLSSKLLSSPSPSPLLYRAAEEHLHAYLQADPTSIEGRMLLGQLYLRTGRTEKARPYLEEASKTRKGVLIELAGAYRRLGKPEEAERAAREALAEYKKSVDAQPEATVPRLLMAETTAFLGDFPGAIAVLSAAKKPENPTAFARMYSRLYGEWSQSLGSKAMASDTAVAEEMVRLLAKAVAADPTDASTVDRLVPVMANAKDPASSSARSLLETLADGKSPAAALANLALGNHAYARKDVETAGDRWQRSLKLDPGNSMTSNNVAWFLTTRKSPDLDRALQLADNALRVKPKEAVYLGTRGEILLKLGRTEEAVNDLETAVKTGADTDDVRAALDEALAKLGKPPAPPRKAATPAAPPAG